MPWFNWSELSSFFLQQHHPATHPWKFSNQIKVIFVKQKMKLFILKGSGQADQINLIKSRQSHQVAQVIPNQVEQIDGNQGDQIKVHKASW